MYNQYIYHCINYQQCLVLQSMAEWKLRKTIENDRIKTSLKEHHRIKSEDSQKILNPWDRIGQALTQRYNRKFLELEKLELQEKLDTSIEGPQTPKFQIKRKYLSFDYKGRAHLQISCDLNRPSQLEKIKKVHERLILEPKAPRQSIQRKKKSDVDRNYHIKTQQTPIGFNFINLSSKPNYKCIYVKKNRKKMGFNPQLHISLKKTEAKVVQYPDFENQKSKRTHNQSNHAMGHSIQKNKLNRNFNTSFNKEKKMFRPWSGYSDEENF